MDKMEELLTRGVEKIYPSKSDLENILRSGKKLKLYQGFDPTGTQLHIGHMVGFRKLAQWQALGHEVIFLIGDFTAKIGDPTGKLDSRRMLTNEEVLENAKAYKEQAGKILNFKGHNPITIRYNSEWLEKMNAMEFLELIHHLTYAQVVERDMFQKRLKKGQDVFMNEFLYPVTQAFDSVYLNIDLEIGGSDQMFNMMMGRKLMRNLKQKEKFVMTTPLLTDSEGRKIGKTEGNVIALNDKPEDLFRKIMTLGDDVIIKALEYLTDISMDEIRKIDLSLKNGENPVKYKKLLAYEVVKQLNDESEAIYARDYFEKTVQQKELPTDIPVYMYTGQNQIEIADLLTLIKFAGSKAEAKRLIEQGGVEIYNEKIKNTNAIVEIKNGMIVKVGKRRLIKIVDSKK